MPTAAAMNILMMGTRTTHADALHAAGRREEAAQVVRRRRAAPEGMAARISAALFRARLSVLRPAAGQGRPRRRARPGEPNLGMGSAATIGCSISRSTRSPSAAPISGWRSRPLARSDRPQRRAMTRAPPAPASTRPSTACAPPGTSDHRPSRPPRPRRLPPQRRRLGRRHARSRRGRGDRRAGADAALSLRHGARTRAARVRAGSRRSRRSMG